MKYLKQFTIILGVCLLGEALRYVMVRELGLYRDTIPAEKEGTAREDLDHLR